VNLRGFRASVLKAFEYGQAQQLALISETAHISTNGMVPEREEAPSAEA
jgi:hypothetical protein